MYAQLAQVPPHTISPFSGPQDTIATMIKQIKGARGERSVLVRQVLEDIIRYVQPKDYLSEILAVRYWVAEHLRFSNDPRGVEWVRDPQRLVEEVLQYGITRADCDEIAELIATFGLQLGRDADLVTVGFGKAGSYSHVFARIKEPKSNQFIVTDPVAGTTEADMLRRVTTYKIWRID